VYNAPCIHSSQPDPLLSRQARNNASVSETKASHAKMNRLSFWAITAAASLNLSALFLSFHGRTLSQIRASPEVIKSYKRWSNDHNVVHIIQTRFQQHQPDLVHLGRARLSLFKSFCLPTVSKQTSRQFLWIIRAGKGTSGLIVIFATPKPHRKLS
jgi:hypothetical protein